MRCAALILALLLAACSAGEVGAPETPPTAAPTSAASSPEPQAAPAAQRVDCQDERNGGYGNAKECYYATCEMGDPDACKMAESYNGNPFPNGDPNAVRFEGMAYVDAREVILALGWSPVEGSCSGGGTGETTCADFPEIGNCSGTGLGYCDMTFRRKDRCLSIVVTEGPPDRANPEGTPVDWVRFSKAPCTKDPNDSRG